MKKTTTYDSDPSDQESFSDQDFSLGQQDEVEVLGESSDQEFTDWGSSKRSFYNNNNNDDDLDSGSGSDAEAMLEETLKVQRKQASLLKDEDFFPDPDSFQSLLAQSNSSINSIFSQIKDQEATVTDSEQVASLLVELNEILEKVSLSVDISSIESVSGGLSFFNSRNSLMLNYALNVVFFLLLKSQGKQTEGHPVISHLIKLKLLLEKVVPLESKLTPQTDRLVKAANQQQVTDYHNQQSFKANLEELVSQGSDSEQEPNSLYKAPKIAPVKFQDSKGGTVSKRTPANGKSSKVIDKNILKDLQDEFNDRPEEIFDNSLLQTNNSNGKLKQQLDYEESTFTRLSHSKKELKREQKRKFTNELKELNSFHKPKQNKRR